MNFHKNKKTHEKTNALAKESSSSDARIQRRRIALRQIRQYFTNPKQAIAIALREAQELKKEKK